MRSRDSWGKGTSRRCLLWKIPVSYETCRSSVYMRVFCLYDGEYATKNMDYDI